MPEVRSTRSPVKFPRICELSIATFAPPLLGCTNTPPPDPLPLLVIVVFSMTRCSASTRSD
ncbi:MAG: hypothetical protein WDM92_05785 [Caulobacteraceae bacterium]